MNNIFCRLFLINIHLFFSGRLRRLSRSAGGEQGTEFKGNHKQVTFSKNCCKPRILFSGGSRRRWRTGRWTSPTTTTPTRRTRMAAFPQTWSNTRSTVKVSFELNFFRSRSASPIVQTRECANGPGVTRGVKTCQSSANTLQVNVP